MKRLFEALKILEKYMKDENYPTWCEHDVLGINVDPEKISEEDLKKLENLSFFYDKEYESLISFEFGSC